MLARDVEILDIDPEQYERIAGLFDTGGAQKSGLILFYSDNRLLHAVHTKKGPLDGVTFNGPERLRELAERYEADFVLCLEKNALRRMAADAQAKLLFDDPMSLQLLTLHAAFDREFGAGIHIYPDPFAGLPKIPQPALKLIRRFVLVDSLIMRVVFDEGGSVWTSAIAEIKNSEISFLTTTDYLEPLELAGMSFEEAAAKINSSLERKRGRATIAVFLEKDALAHIIKHPKPVSTAFRLARRGWIMMRPFPSRLRLLARFAALMGK